MSKSKSKTKTLQNGRSSSGRGFASVPIEMVESPAFLSLRGGAIRVLLCCLFKNYKATTSRHKADQGKPSFKFTYAEAKTVLGMSPKTFDKAKDEVLQKGFIECRRRGGLKGVNGVASEYCLSGKWKEWSSGGAALHGKNLKSLTP